MDLFVSYLKQKILPVESFYKEMTTGTLIICLLIDNLFKLKKTVFYLF